MSKVCSRCHLMFKWLDSQNYRLLRHPNNQSYLLKGGQQNHKMASTTGTDHLDRTAHNKRQEMISPAKVKVIKSISPTVKQLNLQIMNSSFDFKAGQWVDMFIPGVDTVGGYSICSAPHSLVSSDGLSLAVKFATHPPAYWIHSKCKPGDEVKIRAGGDFFYDPPQDGGEDDLLLIAGGVGINPLYSILSHFVYLHPPQHHMGDAKVKNLPRAVMLYSARTTEDLIFQDELMEIASNHENVDLKLHCTRKEVEHTDFLTGGRIQLEDINNVFTKGNKRKTKVYICGPGGFIKSMESYCLASGIDESSIFYESWW